MGEAGNEVFTAMKSWPTLPVTVSSQTFPCPAVLEVL
jgi:hypothetical protein